jgi:predicted transposase/invertase (TIGR01784 family)
MEHIFEGAYINPLTDFGFKKLFGTESNKALLIDFLNALIDRPDKITDIRYLPTEHLGKTQKNRNAFYDIHCVTSKKEWFIIEMQVAKQKYILDRCLFYLSFLIQKQAKKGRKWNYKMDPLYHIAIIKFKYFGDEHVISHLSLFREETMTRVLDTPKIIVVELHGFTKKLHELTSNIDRWLYCLKYLGQLEKQPHELSDPLFDTLFEEAEINKLTSEDMELYNKSITKDWDIKLAMDCSREEGVEEGMERGKEQGKFEIAKKLLDIHLPVQDIVDITGLSPEKILSL